MTPSGEKPFDITQITIEEEMKRSYLDYAMSVIVSRALPDVRDGLKPVHRRILFSMHENGYDSTKPYRKSARIVGDVMGKYHPHGDQAIYDAMVRMAQDFSMRLMLIDGQGNFGSMDGDPAAAMRYTEARLAKAAESLIDDIDKETVDFQANYDESSKEPMVLPARFPNLLVNGAGGIAVGMATNIPPHNLGEVIDACLAYLDNPDISVEELIEIVPGPDFPTGALILGRAGIRAAYHTGRGSVVMRGRTHFETLAREREAIVVTEIPYQVNKARMLERIAELVRDKTIDGISDLRDESDRDGVRVVVELKRDAMADVVLAQLYRFSPLQTSFGVNMLALNGGRPEMMTLRDIIVAFLRFREEVVTRRTIFELRKSRERAHILAGLLVAINNIDQVIELIRRAADPATARQQLMERDWPAEEVAPFIRLIDDPGHQVIDGKYRLSEPQARAILDLRLQRLTGMEREKLVAETKEIADKIEGFLAILQSRDKLLGVIRGELAEMREAYADDRRTTIEDLEFEQDIEDLIQREDMVVTVTYSGYIKRVPLSTYRAQRRGGKGRAGMSTREGDFVSRVFVTSTHTRVLFFSTRGIVYELKVYKLPLGSPQARGKAMVNLLPLADGETISTVMMLPEDESEAADSFVMFATSGGDVRRNRLSDFVNIKANGKIAMKLQDDERLVNVRICTESQDVLLATKHGMCIRFPVTDVRVFEGRTSTGVRGVRLGKGDVVISMSMLEHAEIDVEQRDVYLRIASAMRRSGENGEAENGEPRELPTMPQDQFDAFAAGEQFILVVTENGFGKRSSAYEYRITGRGGKGIRNIEVTERNGAVVAAFPIDRTDQLMLVTNGGQLIRCPVDDIRIAGRLTQGVTLLRVGEEERVVSVARLREDGDGPDDDGPADTGPSDGEQGT
ncbi:MAG: DNA gyrase subunit A [Alphaproteobacteria bacterium]|nr:DNA gyrase subunit A [Alphaproteobacteria bacterium]